MAATQNAKGSLATEDEKERPEVAPTTEDVLREKSKSKLVKIVSVAVYIAAVTGNGFLLSVFFLFIWDPQIQATRPRDMAPDYGWLGGPSRLTGGDPSALTAAGIPIPQALNDPRPPAVPHHRIMSAEFTNNVVNSYFAKNVPGGGVVGGIGQAEARVSHGLPSSAQEEKENNTSRIDHNAAAPPAIESKAFVSNSGSSEDDSNSSSSFGGPPMDKRKKPSEEVSSPYQRPQVLQT